MKKIFSILMVAVLLVAMAVPSFASDYEYSLQGVYTFNGDPLEYAPPVNDYEHVLDFTVDFNMAGEDYIVICSSFKIQFGNVHYYVESSSPNLGYTGWIRVYFSDAWQIDGVGIIEGLNTITIANEQEVTETFYNYIENSTVWESIPELVYCDGTSCSVADFDIDGVCDTCGNTLAYSVQRTYTPNNWPSELPSPPLGHDDNYHYVIMNVIGYDVEDESGIYLHTFTPRQEYPTLEWDNRANGDFLTVTAIIDDGLNVAYMNYHKYLLENGEWVQVESSQSKYTARLGVMGMDDVVYSTLNLYTEEGTLFFPVSLWLAVEQVVQGEMVELIPTMRQTMMILTVSGVGLLALLILLHLFRKGLLMR